MDIKKKVNKLSRSAQIQVLGRMAEHADRRKKREALGKAAYANVEMARRQSKKAEAEAEHQAKMQAETVNRVHEAKKRLAVLEAVKDPHPLDIAEIEFLRNMLGLIDGVVNAEDDAASNQPDEDGFVTGGEYEVTD